MSLFDPFYFKTATCSTKGCGQKCDPSTIKIAGKVVGPYCNGCWENIRKCDSCGNIQSTRSMSHGAMNVSFCRDCVEKPGISCPKCKRLTYGALCSNGVCVKCNVGMFKCEICEEYHPVSDNFWNSVENQLWYHEIFKETASGVCNHCASAIVSGVERNEVGNCTCGALTLDYIVDNGTKIFTCQRCVRNLSLCGHCGKLHSGTTRFDGSTYCKECLESEFYFCTICNKLHLKSSQQGKDFTIVNSATFGMSSIETIICYSCTLLVSKCDRCRSVQHKSNLCTVGDKNLCGRCAEYAGVCSKCKKVSYYKSRIRGFDFCRKCAGEKGMGQILNYSYNPPPTFHPPVNTGDKGKLFLGFENETSFPNEDYITPGVAYVYSKFEEDELIIKSDSSINTGFEIVSHPFNFEEIKKRSWVDLFPPKCRQHSSCGMHIHMSKEAFTTFHLFKFLEFINYNPNFIRTIAGRDENHYSQALSKTTDIAKSKHTNTRYSKVNLNKKTTVELRFFAHAVTEEVFLKNIEFAQALYEFSRDNTPKVSKQITKFLEYVKSNLIRFNNLGTFLGMETKGAKT